MVQRDLTTSKLTLKKHLTALSEFSFGWYFSIYISYHVTSLLKVILRQLDVSIPRIDPRRCDVI